MKYKKITSFCLIILILLISNISFAETSVNFTVYSDAAIVIDSSSR